MNSSTSTKTRIYRLMLLSAALLVYADNALAADGVDDAQMQARAMLTGTSGGRTRTADHPIATPSDDQQKSHQDPQAADVGHVPDSKSDVKPAVSARETRVYADASQAARRMIQGLGG